MSCCPSGIIDPPRIPTRLRGMTCEERQFWDPTIIYYSTSIEKCSCRHFTWGTLFCEQHIRPVLSDSMLARRLK